MRQTRGRRRKMKRSTRRMRQQKGGAFVRSGTYGCTYRPPLTCANGSQPGTNGYISKLMPTFYAQREFNQSAPVRNINKEHKYTLPPLHMCRVNPSNITPTIEKECEDQMMNTNAKRASVLYYKDGGEDLESKEFKAYELLSFYRSLQGLFDGLAQLHQANYVHLDIKPENITVGVRGDGSFSLAFIDFGLGTPIHSALEKIVSRALNTEAIYTYWPPEINFLTRELMFSEFREKNENTYNVMSTEDMVESAIYTLQTEKVKDIGKLQQKWYRVPDYIMVTPSNEIPLLYNDVVDSLYRRPFTYLLDGGMKESPKFVNWVGKSNALEAMKWFDSFYSKIPDYSELSAAPEAVQKVLGKLLKGVDMYGMGILLSFAISHLLFSAKWDSKGELEPLLYTSDGHSIEFDKIEPKEAREFILDFFEKGIQPIYTLINKLMDYDYTTRLTAEQAASKYREALKTLEPFLESPKFYEFAMYLRMPGTEPDIMNVGNLSAIQNLNSNGSPGSKSPRNLSRS